MADARLSLRTLRPMVDSTRRAQAGHYPWLESVRITKKFIENEKHLWYTDREIARRLC